MKVVPKSKLESIARDVGKDLGKQADDNALYQFLLHCPGFEGPDGDFYCRLEDVNGMVRNFILWADKKDFAYLKRKRGYRTTNVPDIHEFIESDKYMNMPGVMFKPVAEALWELWHGTVEYTEAIFTGATGTGKSFMLEMSICYMAALTYFLHDVQAELDLAPGTPIYLALQSGSYQRAKNVLFRPIVRAMRLSKFFKDVFAFEPKVQSELLFPNGLIISPFAGGDDAVIGLTVLGAGVTEVNRMAFISDSRRSGADQDRLFDQATRLYDTLVRRMVARTMQLGKMWGKIILDAASEHKDDFTAKRLKQIVDLRQENRNYNVFIYRKMQWEAQPVTRYKGGTFLVETGDEIMKPRILYSREEAIHPDRIIEVPDALRTFFEQDLDGALREYAGITETTEHPAIPYRDNIGKGIAEFNTLAGGMQFFRLPQVQLQSYRNFDAEGRLAPDWDLLINQEYIRRVLLDKTIRVVMHLDPAINHCAMGIAIGHLYGWMLQPVVKRWNPRKREYDELKDLKSPRIVIDGLLEVTAPPGEEVDLEMAQNLVIHISSILNLALVSVDSFQSAQMKQAWTTVGIPNGTLSVDDSPEPYTRFKLGYRDARVLTPDHSTYKREINNLMFDGKKFVKVPGGSKDLTDSAAGVFYLVETHIADHTPTDRSTGGEDRSLQRQVGQRRGRRIAMRSRRN